MKSSREKLIEARAYELWEKEGRPHGAHERHWHQAVQEVDAAASRKPAAPKARKPAAAKAETATAPKAGKAVSKPAGARGGRTKAAKKTKPATT